MKENLIKEINKAYKDLIAEYLLLITTIVIGAIAIKQIEFMSTMFIILIIIVLVMLAGCITMIVCDNQIIDENNLRLEGLKKSEEEYHG